MKRAPSTSTTADAVVMSPAMVTDTSRRRVTFGESIVFWRLPESEGDPIVIDNWASTERLADHLSGLW